MDDDEFTSGVADAGVPPLSELPSTASAANVDQTARPASDSFRRSDAYLARLIARAVARGRRVL